MSRRRHFLKHSFYGVWYGNTLVPFLPCRCANCGMWAFGRAAMQLDGKLCNPID